jgi:parallel beta-helix repeat protein
MKKNAAVYLLMPLLTQLAPAANNPADPGSSGFNRQIYVDSQSPCGGGHRCGTQVSPYKTITEAISGLQPGDEIIIAGHDQFPYHEWINLPKLDKTPGATPATLIRGWKGMQKPIIRGSEPYGEWRPARMTNTYYLRWDYHPPDDPDAVLEPQQVYRGKDSLQQVGGTVYGGYPERKNPDLGTEDIWPGRISGKNELGLGAQQFFYDPIKKYIYVRLDSPLKPNETLEVSTRHFVAVNNTNYRVNNLTFRDIVFERSNTSHYWRGGAISLSGNDITLDRIVVQDMDSFCVHLAGDNNNIKNSLIQRCGQMGLSAGGNNLTVDNNQFLYNNSRLFNPFWEAGAMKFVSTPPLTNSHIINNLVAFTRQGDGVWLDSMQNNNIIANNKIAYNGGIGIHIEISNKADIKGNVIIGNGAQGVQLVNSAETSITGNTIVGNVQDAVLIQTDSRALTYNNYASSNNKISDNFIAWNWETSSAKNFRSIAVTENSTATMSGNTYCGTAVGNPPTMIFAIGSKALDWANWNKTGRDQRSRLLMGAFPTDLKDRLNRNDMTLVDGHQPIKDYIQTKCK